MASELPTSALSNLASSVKNIVTGQPTEVETTHAEAKTATGGASANKRVEKTVDSHDAGTTVHKEKAAAVLHEEVKPHEHEKVDTLVDREVHKDHYHTTVQPIKDTKNLPTEHVYQDTQNEVEVDRRDNKAKEAAARESAKIRNEKVVDGTTHSKEYAPVKENEHIHHHLHETIQPVIERETRKEKVIHTTDRFHEVEHLNDEHHSATVAEPISMADYEGGAGLSSDSKVTKELLKGETGSLGQDSAKHTSVSASKKGHVGEGLGSNSKKRDVDVDAATNVGKLDATEAHNPLTG